MILGVYILNRWYFVGKTIGRPDTEDDVEVLGIDTIQGFGSKNGHECSAMVAVQFSDNTSLQTSLRTAVFLMESQPKGQEPNGQPLGESKQDG